ncbi:unnamed protein product [Paramecium octaurelia]|uniref:Tetratricopeptide repeat protein n=1 Tax=Paramecium octaurelia TaxID=43137 RepID=A0A8S1VT18_PAROT|nr:unnamed protein product [Paramecium octaurelia]
MIQEVSQNILSFLFILIQQHNKKWKIKANDIHDFNYQHVEIQKQIEVLKIFTLHSNCKKDLKGFGQIQSLIKKFHQNILDLATQLNKSFAQVKIKYEEFQKQLENMQTQLVKISECLSQQHYQQMKANLQVIKELYQYLNNQEEIMKQNQIGTQLVRIKLVVQALDLDKGQQCKLDIKQDNENILNQGILVVKIKLGIQLIQMNQKSNHTRLVETAGGQSKNYLMHKISRETIIIGSILQNYLIIQLGQGRILREQAKKINNNLYGDPLDYSDQELRKTQENTFIFIAKSYALNEENQFQQAIEFCNKVLREDPQHLHALYRKSYSLDDLKQYSQAILCIEIALKFHPKYCIGYLKKGYSLGEEWKYKDEIVCYDKAIQLDPNYAMAYNNKGIALQYKQVDQKIFTKILMQLFAMIKQFKQIQKMQVPILIKGMYQQKSRITLHLQRIMSRQSYIANQFKINLNVQLWNQKQKVNTYICHYHNISV